MAKWNVEHLDRSLEVDAIDGDAQAFYFKYGFNALLDRPHHLLLPLRTIETAMARSADQGE